MSETVIVNSTPIIALSSIDEFHLLKDIYGTVIIPNAVKTEIGTKSKSKAHKLLYECSDWINARACLKSRF